VKVVGGSVKHATEMASKASTAALDTRLISRLKK
jgi:hypothetical protein